MADPRTQPEQEPAEEEEAYDNSGQALEDTLDSIYGEVTPEELAAE